MNKHYYAITNEMPDTEGELILTVTPAEHYDREKCLSDRPMDLNIHTELENMGFYGAEMMDSVLEVHRIDGDRPNGLTELTLKLEAHPDFITNDEFVAFANNFGDYTDA
jgi:hypothetical protein